MPRPRELAFANVRKAIKEAKGDAADPAALAPGYMRLYRFWQPSLEPGLYGIAAVQTVKTTLNGTNSQLTIYNFDTPTTPLPDPKNPTVPVNEQQFNVIAPQFQIDPKTVNSFYPPQGHVDEGRVLPHIVFNDPHIPWDRPIQDPSTVDPPSTSNSSTADPKLTPEAARLLETFKDSVRTGPDPAAQISAGTAPLPKQRAVRNSLYVPPWFALVCFDPDELKLASADETALGIPAAPAPAPAPSNSTNPLPQIGTSSSQVETPGAYQMSVGTYLTSITSRINYEAGYQATAAAKNAFSQLQQSTDLTNIIFPTKALALEIFNNPIKFVLTSHVREINTTGFPDAGVQEQGLYAVTISHRSGPTTYAANANTIPQTQVVHLVSLEYVPATNFDSKGPSDRIGMVSLYSWTYLAVPPDPVNFLTVMTNLANTMQMLTAPQGALDDLSASIPKHKKPELKAAAQHLYDRLSRGYTITRWRTAVGEESVAYTRGPLTPLLTPWKPSIAGDWPGSSNSGKDYQILDKDLGVMDVSYSAAWQLGKLMAISDNTFNQALLRFRSLVHEVAASNTRMIVNGVASKKAVLANLSKAVEEIHASMDGTRAPRRVMLPSTDKVAPPFSDPKIAPIFEEQLKLVIDGQVAAGEAIYNDYNLGSANNTDWEIILNWISDKLFLGGIPAHYMITDPSLLPSEALRFFYIDSAWMDCYIDGALSVANHLEPVDDKVRRRIKDVFNVYLANDIGLVRTLTPPIPRYGFIMRSKLLKVMPDLKVTVTCRTGTAPNFTIDTTRAPLVRLTKLDDYTLLALLNCYPEEIDAITFTQPPHQQRFVAGAEPGSTPPWDLRQLYTQNAPTGTWPPLAPASYPTDAQLAAWYDPSTRCLNLVQMISDMVTALSKNTDFDDNLADSVTFALELNDPTYQIQILPPTDSKLPTTPDPIRQLWVGVDVNDPEDPIPAIPPGATVSTGAQVASKSVRPPASEVASLPQSVKRRPKPSSLTVHPTSALESTAPLPPPLNLSAQPILAVTTQPPPKPIPITPPPLTPQFNLSIYPAYRGPAPLPDTSTTPWTWSAHDYIPTATTYLFSLYFSIQLSPTAPSTLPPLLSLKITIPTTNPANKPDTAQPEPLIAPYSGPGAAMLKNKHWIPLLTSSLGTLTVTIVPRSSIPGAATFSPVPGAVAGNASFQLKEVEVAEVVQNQMVKIVGQAATAGRGIAVIGVEEMYQMPDGTTQGVSRTWQCLKKTGGDEDTLGNPV